MRPRRGGVGPPNRGPAEARLGASAADARLRASATGASRAPAIALSLGYQWLEVDLWFWSIPLRSLPLPTLSRARRTAVG